MTRWSYAIIIMAGLATPVLGQHAPEGSRKSSRPSVAKSTSSGKKTASDTARPANSAAKSPVNIAAFNERELSRMVFDLTNQERVRAGLQPLSENRALAASARAHSADMASRAYFAHKSKGFLNRTNPSDRASAAGYRPAMVAENIAMIPTYNRQTIQTSAGYGPQVIDTDWNSYEKLAEIANREWMNSPGHRANILNRQLNCLGVGVAVGMRNNVPYVYLTQNFGG